MNPRTLKELIRSRLNPSPEDLAVRAWKASKPSAQPSPDPTVIFCAPLMGRHMANDWATVSAGFARTIDSLKAQTDPNWHLIVTSQDRPDPLDPDPRITFLRFDQPVDGFDKEEKVAFLMDRLPGQMGARDGYMHALDADDVVHPGLVAHIRTDNNGRGYWHRTGGMIDVATGEVAQCGPRRLRYPTSRPFLSQCGSCAAIYVDFRDGAEPYAAYAKRLYGATHRNFCRVAAAHGVPLDPLPFPGALYVMNTGENDRQRIGKMDNKMRYLRQNLLPERVQAEWRDLFGWQTATAATAAASAAPAAATPRG